MLTKVCAMTLFQFADKAHVKCYCREHSFGRHGKELPRSKEEGICGSSF